MCEKTEEYGRLIPLDGCPHTENSSSGMFRAADSSLWTMEVQGELPCVEDVIHEMDGVFRIDDVVNTERVIQNASFKELVDSIMKR